MPAATRSARTGQVVPSVCTSPEGGGVGVAPRLGLERRSIWREARCWLWAVSSPWGALLRMSEEVRRGLS